MGCNTEQIKKDTFNYVKGLVETATIKMDANGTVRFDHQKSGKYNEKSITYIADNIIKRVHDGRGDTKGVDKLFGNSALTQGIIYKGRDENGIFLQYRFPQKLEVAYKVKNQEFTEEEIAQAYEERAKEERKLKEEALKYEGVDKELRDFVIKSKNVEGYNNFNFGNILILKRKLKTNLEKKRKIISNMKETDKTQRQIADLNSLIRRLKKDLDSMRSEEKRLDNFIKYFEKDLKAIKNILSYGNYKSIDDVLDNQTIDNISAIESYFSMLDQIFSTGDSGMFKEDIADIGYEVGGQEARDKVRKVMDEIEDLKRFHKRQKENLLIGLIDEQLEYKYKDFSDEKRRKLAINLYINDIKKKTEDLRSAEFLVKTMDSDSKKMPLNELMFDIFNNAHDDKAHHDIVERLIVIKPKLEKVLSDLGFENTGKWLGKWFNPVSYDLFFKKTKDGLNLLIQKFTPSWNTYKRSVTDRINTLINFTYAENPTPEDRAGFKEKEQDLFDDMMENTNFFDLNLIPEIRQNPDFENYVTENVSIEEAEAYKQKVISDIGEIEYYKLLGEQELKAYDYISSMNYYINTLEQENVDENGNPNVPEFKKNSYLRTAAKASPFNVNRTVANTKGNTVDYTKRDGTAVTVKADLQYISFYPKRETRPDFYDKEFENVVEKNDTLIEAWRLMDKSLIYINQNGHNDFNKKYVFDNSIGYQRSAIQAHLFTGSGKLIPMLARETLNFVKKILTMTKYQDPSLKIIKGGLRSLDEVVNERVKIYMEKAKKTLKLTGSPVLFRELDTEARKFLTDLEIQGSVADYKGEMLEFSEMLRRIVSERLMAEQEVDLIDSLVSQMDMVNKFKAKREVETKLKFIMSEIDRVYHDENKETDFKYHKNINAKALAEFFMERKLYGIDNTSNFPLLRKNPESKKVRDYGRVVYNSAEKEIIKVVDETIAVIDNQLKYLTDQTQRKEAQFEKDSLLRYKESMGRILNPGSVIEFFILKLMRFKAFAGNLKAQTVNYAMGDFNAREVDGMVWMDGNYDRSLTFWKKRFTKKLTKTDKDHWEIALKFLERVNLFQNSANEIYRVKKSMHGRGKRFSRLFKDPTASFNPTQVVGWTEKKIQIPQMLAALGNFTPKKGVGERVFIKNKNGVEHPVFNPSSKDPFIAFNIDDGGNIVLTEDFDTPENRATWINNSSKDYKRIFGLSGYIPKTIAYINGDYRDSSVYWLEKTFLGKVIFMFKRWMPAQILKNLKVFKELGEAGASDKANVAFGLNAALRIAESGTLFGTIPMFAALTAYGIVAGKQMHIKSIRDGINTLKAFAEAITFESVRHGFGMTTRMVSGSMVKTVQMLVNTVAGYKITNEMVDRAAGLDKLDGENADVIRQNLQFLMTGFARTAIFTAMRLAVHAILFPDDEEKAEYESDKHLFWRMYNQLSPTMYYTLENLLSNMLEDTNLFLSTENAVRSTLDFRGITAINALLNGIDKDLMKGELTAGPNQGDTRTFSFLKRMTRPAMLDNLGMGFNVYSKKDFNPADPVDQLFKSDFQRYNDRRKDMRIKRREELESFPKYEDLKKTEKSKRVTKILNKEYPSIKKYFDETGEFKKESYKNKKRVKQYE